MVDSDSTKVCDIRSPGTLISVRSIVATCPVKIFRCYLSEVGKFLVVAGYYVFWALYKFKLSHRLVSVDKLLSYSCTRDYFKSSFRGLVPDISLHVFSKNCLRAGGASAAANVGVPHRVFQRHGHSKICVRQRWLCR